MTLGSKENVLALAWVLGAFSSPRVLDHSMLALAASKSTAPPFNAAPSLGLYQCRNGKKQKHKLSAFAWFYRTQESYRAHFP